MKCSVERCNNGSSNKSSTKAFLLFPSDQAVAEKWLRFCQRPEPFNHRYTLICRDHFVDEDFESFLQYKMGFARHLKLKRGAGPTISRIATESSVQKQRIERRQQKQIVKSLIKEYDQKEKIMPICSEFDEQCNNEDNKEKLPVVITHKYAQHSLGNNIEKEIQFEEVEVGYDFHYEVNVYEEVEELRTQLKCLRKQNICLRKINKELCKKLEKWKKLNIQKVIQNASRASKVNVQLRNKIQECQNLEERLEVIFTSGQINKMKSAATVYHWNEENIVKSFTLYESSGKAYKLLYDNGFPLPSIRNLLRWKYGRKIDTSNGINEPENKSEPETIHK